jgi:cold shock CspA family protein
MTETVPVPPADEPSNFVNKTRPGRTLAWIARVETRERGFIFARTAEAAAEELFIHISSMSSPLWAELATGDVISCKVTDGPKGPRGFAVQRVVDADVIAQVKAKEEDYGNR